MAVQAFRGQYDNVSHTEVDEGIYQNFANSLFAFLQTKVVPWQCPQGPAYASDTCRLWLETGETGRSSVDDRK